MSPPITIVTGFLGSGKTTLLKALLERGADGRRVGLVVNEFGQIGIDGAALQRAGAPPLVELTGGCLCCEAGSDFLVAVEELSDYDPDQIVVETSGLAEPGAIIRRARGAGLRLDAVVAVADALNLEAALAAAPVAAWQLRAADLIVLSKVDLAVLAALAGAEARLRELNSRAAIVHAANGALPPDLIFGPRLAPDEPAEVVAHREADGFSSLVWSGDAPLRRAALEEAVAALPAAVYRAKGLVQCTDAPWADEVQLVCGRLSLSAVRLREPSRPLNRIVLLGRELEGQRQRLIELLDACADTPERGAAWWARRDA